MKAKYTVSPIEPHSSDLDSPRRKVVLDQKNKNSSFLFFLVVALAFAVAAILLRSASAVAKLIPAEDASSTTTRRWVDDDNSAVEKLVVSTEESDDGDDGGDNPGDYAVMIVHYHKTGHHVSRGILELIKDVAKEAKIELGERKPVLLCNRRNAKGFHTRAHDPETKCPFVDMHPGRVYLYSAPDFYCKGDSFNDLLLTSSDDGDRGQGRRSLKVIHMIRNPFDMIVSNFLYHSQDPTPESWVHFRDPCDSFYRYADGTNVSLASLILPTLSTSYINGTQIVAQLEFDRALSACRALYQSTPSLQSATYYAHLRNMNFSQGVLLSAAQSTIQVAPNAGGDVFRMANNIVKLRDLQLNISSSTKPETRGDGNNDPQLLVMSTSMENWITDPKGSAMKVLEFAFGLDSMVVSTKLKREASRRYANTYTHLKKDKHYNHVTHGRHNNSEELKNVLRKNAEFGPSLARIEALVEEALGASYDPYDKNMKRHSRET